MMILPQALFDQTHRKSGTWRRDLRLNMDVKVEFERLLWLFYNFFRLGIYRRQEEKCWEKQILRVYFNLDEWVNVSNRPFKELLSLQLLQHLHRYVQVLCRDITRVSDFPGMNRKFFSTILHEP